MNAQKNWLRQDDATYLAVHCMLIRENETGLRHLTEGKEVQAGGRMFTSNLQPINLLGQLFCVCCILFRNFGSTIHQHVSQNNLPTEDTVKNEVECLHIDDSVYNK